MALRWGGRYFFGAAAADAVSESLVADVFLGGAAVEAVAAAVAGHDLNFLKSDVME